MSEIIDFFRDGLTGSILGVIGLLFAYYAHRKSKVKKSLVYAMSSLEIINPDKVETEEIEISYKGIGVPRVLKTTIIIWNSGDKVIDSNDIVVRDPVRAAFSSGERILSSSIIKTTSSANGSGIEIGDDNRILNVSFDYLDPNDGMTIEVIHTDGKRYPEIKGKVKGMPKGLRFIGKLNRRRLKNDELTLKVFNLSIEARLPKRIAIFSMGFVGILSILAGILAAYNEDFHNIFMPTTTEDNLYLVPIIVGIIYAFIPLLLLWVERRKFPRALDPDSD